VKKQTVLLIVVFLMFILAGFTLAGCGAAENGNAASSTTQTAAAQTAAQTAAAAQVIIGFDYQSQPGSASNQFAVWIEDANGNLTKTLYVTKYTATGGYKNRPDSIFNWVAKAELAAMSKCQVDAIAGATPKSGKLAYVWDLTDSDGNAVPSGSYTFVVEGTLRWKNYVLFGGTIVVGGENTVATAVANAVANAEPVYHFEDDGSNAALTEEAAEVGMITNVTVDFITA
jgi:hypothetical protein